MFFAYFYAPLVPLLMIIVPFNLFFNYWMDKYLLLTRNARPNLISSDLNSKMIEVLEFAPILMALGSLFAFSALGDLEDTGVIIYIAIVITVINYFLPSKAINKRICKI